MSIQQEQVPVAIVGDSYDLTLGLRRRLADAVQLESTSVASQLQSAARQRLGSDLTVAGKDRHRLPWRRRAGRV
jgi:hypothetical protein